MSVNIIKGAQLSSNNHSNDKNAIKPIVLTSTKKDATEQENVVNGTELIDERWRIDVMVRTSFDAFCIC